MFLPSHFAMVQRGSSRSNMVYIPFTFQSYCEALYKKSLLFFEWMVMVLFLNLNPFLGAIFYFQVKWPLSYKQDRACKFLVRHGMKFLPSHFHGTQTPLIQIWFKYLSPSIPTVKHFRKRACHFLSGWSFSTISILSWSNILF